MFGKKAKNIYLGEVVLRPGKHYILAYFENCHSNKFIFPSDNNELFHDMNTSYVYCPPGYHLVSYSAGYGARLLYENDVDVKVRAYQDRKTKQKIFPEFGVPVR